jgi:hypothetical protein
VNLLSYEAVRFGPKADINDMSGWVGIEDEQLPTSPSGGELSNEFVLPPALPASHKYHDHLVR